MPALPPVQHPPPPALHWTVVAEHPESLGGVVSGDLDGTLIVAGGNNFPDEVPWRGGKRKYHDSIYLYTVEDGWTRAPTSLPIPLSYAAAAPFGGGLLIAGGETPDRAAPTDRVFFIKHAPERGDVVVSELHPLPVPLSHAAVAKVGRFLFLAGGLSSPTGASVRGCWVATWNPAGHDVRWTAIEPWPGVGRHLAVAGSDNRSFYLFSGMTRTETSEGAVSLIKPYLRDDYVFEFDGTPSTGHWLRLPDMPQPAAAAPTPALDLADRQMIVVPGGLVGDDVGADLDHYPPFPRHIQFFDTRTKTWSLIPDAIPPDMARVTAPTVKTAKGWVVVGGETRPGRRSGDVIQIDKAARFGPDQKHPEEGSAPSPVAAPSQ